MRIRVAAVWWVAGLLPRSSVATLVVTGLGRAVATLLVALVVAGLWLAPVLVITGLRSSVALVVALRSGSSVATLVITGLLLPGSSVALFVAGLTLLTITIGILLAIRIWLGIGIVIRLLALLAALRGRGPRFVAWLALLLAIALLTSLTIRVVWVVLAVSGGLAHCSISCVAGLCCRGILSIEFRYVRIHRRAGLELSSVQRLVALERNYDVTISVPPVLRQMLCDSFREHVGDALFVSGHPVMISSSQRHDIVVGCEQSTAGQLANIVLTLTL